MADLRSRIFFAVRPSAAATAEMARLASALSPACRCVARERLHLTLALLGDYASLPQRLVGQASGAVERSIPAACRIVVDLLVSGRHSTLLMPSEPVLGLIRLRTWLGSALAQAGIAAPPPARFAPHVTLGYDRPSGATRAIDPIGWRAEELLLIHSHLGRARHDVLGRWPLPVGG